MCNPIVFISITTHLGHSARYALPIIIIHLGLNWNHLLLRLLLRVLFTPHAITIYSRQSLALTSLFHSCSVYLLVYPTVCMAQELKAIASSAIFCLTKVPTYDRAKAILIIILLRPRFFIPSLSSSLLLLPFPRLPFL